MTRDELHKVVAAVNEVLLDDPALALGLVSSIRSDLRQARQELAAMVEIKLAKELTNAASTTGSTK